MNTPAFPIESDDSHQFEGLTKREYAAIRVLASLVSNNEQLNNNGKIYSVDEKVMCAQAIRLTDELFKQLEA